MLHGKRLMVVMPAFRAAKTVEATWRGLPHDIVDKVLLVDDASHDETAEIARGLGIDVLLHETNQGYGANQKTCYEPANGDQCRLARTVTFSEYSGLACTGSDYGNACGF